MPTLTRLRLALLRESRYEEAFSEIQKSVNLSGRDALSAPKLIYAYSLVGRKVDAERLLADLELKTKQEYIPNVVLADHSCSEPFPSTGTRQTQPRCNNDFLF